MATDKWPTTTRSVSSLRLDSKNPRLGQETLARAPRDILQYLFDHDKAIEVAQSIATRGYFPNEPLLAVREEGHLVVVEGNRRLAALKVLREPGLLEGPFRRQAERLVRQMDDPNTIASVPVCVAPSRRATDRLLAGRHIGTPVLAWQAENRASFILEKLSEGYSNSQLHDQLGFSISDIQSARQTRAIAEMARSLDLNEETRAKLENPRAKVFTTLRRVFDSSVGRKYLHIATDSDHGIRGTTTKNEFVRGFKKLVEDVALGRASSRTLNSNSDIEKYFKKWDGKELPKKKRGMFVPSDIIKGRSIASPRLGMPERKPKMKNFSITVLPKDLKVIYGNERLVDIRKELVRLKRDEYPNAGAVLLRVFFELSVIQYLERKSQLDAVISDIEKKEARRLPHGRPTMRQLVPVIVRIAKAELPGAEATRVEKALRYDPSAPFSISELHNFVHQVDLPTSRDILQFWTRTEPLFRLMLEKE